MGFFNFPKLPSFLQLYQSLLVLEISLFDDFLIVQRLQQLVKGCVSLELIECSLPLTVPIHPRPNLPFSRFVIHFNPEPPTKCHRILWFLIHLPPLLLPPFYTLPQHLLGPLARLIPCTVYRSTPPQHHRLYVLRFIACLDPVIQVFIDDFEALEEFGVF
ncbi:hypothetical protein FGO68_gene3946 [Halteria grandinella]|uniref:Uncharacterized protein n=1 Tax=Halteria grandinella TaxID=5974 RepID=A0A8J8NS13_HALGN|nr:hypothetical protein FGO68_gene3946 [Halteria grandinella]